MAAGETISSPAQYCGLRLRRGTRIQELRKLLQRLCEALGQEYRGQRRRLGKIFLKLLKAKREVIGAAERQKTLEDGKCAARLRADGFKHCMVAKAPPWTRRRATWRR